MRSRKRTRHEEEDATEQAGWLFADSFLALMVIFLATISFVPDIKNVEDTVNNYTKALTLTYTQYDPVKIQSDISGFISREGLDGSSEVVFARIIGGAPIQQNEENGYLLALKYSLQLQRDSVSYFANTRFDMGSSTLVQDQTVLLQLTFAPKGR
ncbi:MAG: hypothetical protein QNK54_03695 [Candidatus Planktophila sp.]